MTDVMQEFAPEAEDQEFLRTALKGENLVELLTEEQLSKLNTDATAGFESDERTMEEWEGLSKKGMDLARMVAVEKSYPWPNAANSKYPLIAQAALQFNARTYPALSPPEGPIKVKVWGDDKDGEKLKRAERVREFMGFQLAVSRWEEDIDRLTIQLPIVGTLFRKIYYDPIRGLTARTCGRVVINNDTSDLEKMPRISEEFELYPDQIVERIRADRFVDFDWQGFVETDEQAPHDFFEQHCRHDLDEDGYPEPYIITIHKKSQKVVRVVANFEEDDITWGENEVIRISAKEYFVAYTFLPSMDGSFLGIGLGHLLTSTNEAINGIVNQILDSGHLASLGGGFIGTGLNLKGGPIRIKPGEWVPVPTAGAVIRDAMVPLQFPGPSDVMFKMLGLLIEAGKDISSITDIMTGDAPTQEQTATTTLALIEQGMMVFTAAYKRLYRAMKREFGLMARINATTVRPEVYNLLQDSETPVDPKQDFDLADLDIMPIADPAQVTNMQKLAKAQLLLELAPQGVVDQRVATMRVLQAAGIEDREELVPEPDPQVEALKGAQQQMIEALQTALMEQQLAKMHAEVSKLLSETDENRAEALEAISNSMANQENMRIDQMLRMLEVLGQIRTKDEAARTGGVAGKPGNAGSPSQPAQPTGGAQEVDIGSVLGAGGGVGNGATLLPGA